MNQTSFKQKIWSYYLEYRRDLPWRNITHPYKIFISEIMLQQTQALRVIPKYKNFIKKFPTFKALAGASLKEVLMEWKGLGYNRRALNMKRAAEIIIREHGGTLPKNASLLKALPGIGPNTSGSLLAFAYNIPTPFIETNIRSVYLHFFFPQKEKINDKELFPLIEATLDHENPREWYYALMDYGAMLKRTQTNPNRRSSHHSRQSPFKGSHRELRSKVLTYIIENQLSSAEKIAAAIPMPLAKASETADELLSEGLLQKTGALYFVD